MKSYRDIERHYEMKGWQTYIIKDALASFASKDPDFLARFAEFMENEQKIRDEHKRRQDNCELDWQLYEMKGSDAANAALCAALREAFEAKGATPNSVRTAMDPVMNKYRNFGAEDTEPCGVLESAIRRRFRVDEA